MGGFLDEGHLGWVLKDGKAFVCQAERMWKLQPRPPEFTSWSDREGDASGRSPRAFPRQGTSPFS